MASLTLILAGISILRPEYLADMSDFVPLGPLCVSCPTKLEGRNIHGDLDVFSQVRKSQIEKSKIIIIQNNLSRFI